MKIHSLGDFAKTKSAYIEQINQQTIDSGALRGYSEDFVRAFSQGNELLFHSQNREDLKKLRELIFEKNIQEREHVYMLLKSGMFAFLSDEEVQTFIEIIESGILQFFDKLYLNWIDSIPLDHAQFPKKGKYDLIYGGIKNEQEVAYTSFCEENKIPLIMNSLEKIPLKSVREGLIGMLELIQTKNAKYGNWVELEGRTELELWKEKDLHIAYVGPMESYIWSEVLVEPEIIFFLKKYEHTANQRNTDLAVKVFGDDYKMDGVHYFYGEEILGCGLAGFKKHAGKNFPNDIPLAQEKGKYIYLMQSSFENFFGNSLPNARKILPENMQLDKEKIRTFFEQFVENHEFGHNLFFRGDSQLEESKPSLFFTLKILDEIEQDIFKNEKIKPLIDLMVLEFLRDIERGYLNYKNNPVYKYTLFSRLVLFGMMQSKIIAWDDTKTRIIPCYDKEKLIAFLVQMKQYLLRIQKIYASPEKAGEKELIQEIEDVSENDFQTIAKILGVA